jgi:Leu/Phe-tRNA-protein transferase
MPITATETTVMHAYRNRQRDGRCFGDAVFGLAWLFGGLVVVAIGESFFGDSLLLLVVSAPVLLVWMAPFYAHFFRRYSEIRLSDEGSCEFHGAQSST